MKMPDSAINNDIRMQGYMLNITLPDGNVTTLGPFIPDSTETTYTQYTPTELGTYSLVFWYPTTVYYWNDTTYALGGGPGGSTDELAWDGDVFTGSTSAVQHFTVTSTPAVSAVNSYPLPTAYWTYPVEGQNTYWADTVMSNWYGIAAPTMGTTGLGTTESTSKIQPDGTGPTSAHILWTDPIPDQAGGIVGGSNVGVPGNMFYTGQSYNQRFANPIIMYGILVYQTPAFTSGGDTVSVAGPTVAIDLKTGKQLWSAQLPTLSFGMNPDWETANQEGVIYNGILFTANYANAYYLLTGQSMFNVTGVPAQTITEFLPGVPSTALFSFVTVPVGAPMVQNSGSDNDAGVISSGAYLTDYVLNDGTAANPQYYLSEWNATNLWTAPSYYPALTTPVNGAAASMYDFNISLPYFNGNPTTSTGVLEVLRAFYGDIMLVINGTIDPSNPGYIMWGGWANTTQPYTITAINLNPNANGGIGSMLWRQTYTDPAGPTTTDPVLVWPETISNVTNIFTMYDTYNMEIYGYSIRTGQQVWGPITQGYPQQPFDVFSGSVSTQNTGSHMVDPANGNLYMSSYGGVVYCYNDSNGDLLWSFGNGGVDNSTQTGYGQPWALNPIMIAAITSQTNMIYCFNNAHSPTTPLYKGSLVYDLNATTGAQIWNLMSWDDGGQFVANGGAIADGEWVYDNVYDMEITAVGQGPSQLTVTAPQTAGSVGTPLVIRGTIMDISAGTKQNEQAADFPNGVPCVSDASQSAWMPYVYMQKPEPTNVTGVPITLSVIDSNGNYRPIGTVTSDSSGMFTYAWAPDIPGSYTLIATFAGSNSYYGSSDETSFYATAAPATPAPTAVPATNLATASDLTLGITAAVIAIIIAIAIVGFLLIRKKP